MDQPQRGATLKHAGIAWLISAMTCTSASLHAQPALLDRLVGRNLWTEKPMPADLAQLGRLIGTLPKGYIVEPSPWHIWKTDQGGQTRYVALLGENPIMIPGGSSACVQLFDSATTMIRSWSFQTGWRIQLQDASLDRTADLDSDLLVIRTSPVINGRDVAKEIFAIGGDRLRLLRLEDSKGNSVPNEYVFPNYEIGIVPQAQTAQEWSDLLQSKDKSEALSALVFLGGRHLAEDERQLLPEPRESKYATLFQELLARPSIRDLIAKLANSSDRWVRDAAILAARGPRQRLLR